MLLALMTKAQTVTDVDGNMYHTVTIGDQTWMQENLKTTHFNNGLAIPTTTSPINNEPDKIYQWSYNDDTTYASEYGRLYTWNVARDTINVCPEGWHVPDMDEWETLREYLGGEAVAGGRMKEPGLAHWSQTDSTVDNASGFTGLGSGFRGNPSGFRNLLEFGGFWTSTPFGSSETFPRGAYVLLDAKDSSFKNSVAVANVGLPIRCLKDAVSSSHVVMNQTYTISLTPNPASDRLTLHMPKDGNYRINIFNEQGQLMHRQEVAGKETDIDITRYPSGTYLLEVNSAGQRTRSTFIKL